MAQTPNGWGDGALTVDYGAARRLFLAALAHPPNDRKTFLESQCDEDSALLAEVLSLLDFHEDEEHNDPVLIPLRVGDKYADRYRILRRLGRGGMGDVYHAHDEALNESVALKRLTGTNKSYRDALRNEVKLARRVTHPRICRVYDFGEWQGEHFLTMEFVDGEDLGKLIRRVGRLPAERVSEMARELCVGLAAAHDKGVLHRDLKPANILVDGDGHLHITDFGIAARSGGHGTTELAGTPSYMAPEQLVSGGNSTERSDIYALGLVIHEMLTGQPVFRGAGLADALTSRKNVVATPPSETVPEIPPDLDRAVMQSLNPNPNERPASAVALASMLPGGDALRAALEANTTPSPELIARVADSQQTTGNSGPKLLGLVVLLVTAFVLADALQLFPLNDTQHPAVSEHRAIELARELGYDVGGHPSFRGYMEDPTSPFGETSLMFWYREDRPPQRTMFQRSLLDPAAALTLYVAVTDPSPDRFIVVFDAQGQLVYFEAPPVETSSDTLTSLDWQEWLATVGVDVDGLKPTTPETPPVFATSRAAWIDAPPDQPQHSERIDAAAFHSRLVYFSRTHVDEAGTSALDNRIQSAQPLIINLLLVPTIIVVAIVFLIGNIRARRVDGSGTLKLVGTVGVFAFAKWLLLVDHIYHPLSEHSEVIATSWMVVPSIALTAAIFYLALEPPVRRVWPQTLLAWTRVLRGDVRNSLVGQSILTGCVAGSMCALVYLVDLAIPGVVPALKPLSLDHGPRLVAALGFRETLAVLSGNVSDAIVRGVIVLFLFTMLKSWIGRPVVATTVFVILVAVLESVVTLHHPFSVVTLGLPVGIIATVVLARNGLLAYVITGFVYVSIRMVPITLNLDAWWALSGFATVGVVILMAILSAWVSRPRPRWA